MSVIPRDGCQPRIRQGLRRLPGRFPAGQRDHDVKGPFRTDQRDARSFDPPDFPYAALGTEMEGNGSAYGIRSGPLS